jgi:hypothetical protein
MKKSRIGHSKTLGRCDLTLWRVSGRLAFILKNVLAEMSQCAIICGMSEHEFLVQKLYNYLQLESTTKTIFPDLERFCQSKIVFSPQF